jgi:hypothetical protein
MYLHNVKLELFRGFKDQLLYHTFGMAVKHSRVLDTPSSGYKHGSSFVRSHESSCLVCKDLSRDRTSHPGLGFVQGAGDAPQVRYT